MVQSKMRVIMMKSAEMKKSEPEKQTIQLTPEQEVVIGRLYDENYNDLFRYAAVLLSASDAEEAVQNLFVDACKPKQLKKLMEYEKNGQFKEQKAWLGKGIKFSISKIRRSKGQFAKSIEYLPGVGFFVTSWPSKVGVTPVSFMLPCHLTSVLPASIEPSSSLMPLKLELSAIRSISLRSWSSSFCS